MQIWLLGLLLSMGVGKLIFVDNFDSLDFSKWHHEITMAGSGNGEFEMYHNNRSITFVTNGTLNIKPQLTVEWLGEWCLKSSSCPVDLWGAEPSSSCTNNQLSGCLRTGNSTHYINPVTSGKLSTINSFSFTYGRVEVRAKLPKGDWLWPAIWFLPQHSEYGRWPASGEIDIMESRGNVDYP